MKRIVKAVGIKGERNSYVAHSLPPSSLYLEFHKKSRLKELQRGCRYIADSMSGTDAEEAAHQTSKVSQTSSESG